MTRLRWLHLFQALPNRRQYVSAILCFKADSYLLNGQLNVSLPSHVALILSYIFHSISRSRSSRVSFTQAHPCCLLLVTISMHLSTQLILIFFTLISGLLADGWDGAILTYDGYVHLRTCAQMCLAGYGNADQPGIYIGCPNPVYDSCFCRGMEDLSSAVTSLISSCVNSRCSSDQTDMTAAFAVYNGYCSQAGYPHVAANAATTTVYGGGSLGAGAGGGATSTVVVLSTVTGSSGVNSVATREFPRLLGPFILGLLTALC